MGTEIRTFTGKIWIHHIVVRSALMTQAVWVWACVQCCSTHRLNCCFTHSHTAHTRIPCARRKYAPDAHKRLIQIHPVCMIQMARKSEKKQHRRKKRKFPMPWASFNSIIPLISYNIRSPSVVVCAHVLCMLCVSSRDLPATANQTYQQLWLNEYSNKVHAYMLGKSSIYSLWWAYK